MFDHDLFKRLDRIAAALEQRPEERAADQGVPAVILHVPPHRVAHIESTPWVIGTEDEHLTVYIVDEGGRLLFTAVSEGPVAVGQPEAVKR